MVVSGRSVQQEGQEQARTAGLLILLFLLGGGVVISLMVGAKPLSAATVWNALTAFDGSYDHTAVQEARVPRTILSLVVGGALGLSGALIQAFTRNPLADPGILGVNAGAAFAVAAGIGLFSVSTISGYMWFAFGGALLATVAVYIISGGAGRMSPAPVQITLAGVALGAVLSGITAVFRMMNSEAFSAMLEWSVGSLARRSLSDLVPVLPFILVGVVLTLALSPALNAVALGDDRAASMGVNIQRTRLISLLGVTLLAGGATAIAGPIGFIGLMVPHSVRWVTGPDQRWIFVYSIVAAPLLLLVSDIIGRVLMPPAEIPVGIITAFLGAPVLIVLIRRKKASGL
ncbi:FecCD family ABC transporter permease [Paenibacillus camerounensis]|uniref:FecCD family ABC transporter permease n=1 Tax=Paenibacillus camerounensis TaxID=1243663 RepID=UPI0005AB6D9E|nr:iron chelate uptake ABC transporter family permease subunit [Paenibacillus camerounensis]